MADVPELSAFGLLDGGRRTRQPGACGDHGALIDPNAPPTVDGGGGRSSVSRFQVMGREL